LNVNAQRKKDRHRSLIKLDKVCILKDVAQNESGLNSKVFFACERRLLEFGLKM
jgi:hypothetical protein